MIEGLGNNKKIDVLFKLSVITASVLFIITKIIDLSIQYKQLKELERIDSSIFNLSGYLENIDSNIAGTKRTKGSSGWWAKEPLN